MGEIADYYVEQMMMGNAPVGTHHGHGNRQRGKQNMNHPKRPDNWHRMSYREREIWEKQVAEEARRAGMKEVVKKFKLINGENSQFAIIIEQGMHRETVAVSFDKSKYRAKGFIKAKEGVFNSFGNSEIKEVIDMREIFNSMVTILNNLVSADLLVEKQYDSVLEAFEPFILEALAFEEIESMIENGSGIRAGKKKKIFRRGKA